MDNFSVAYWEFNQGAKSKMASDAKPRGRALRMFRTIHAWLGIFIFPWVIIIGATGFYLNHPQTILAMLEGPEYAESRFDVWPVTEPVTREWTIDRASLVHAGIIDARGARASRH